MKNVSFLFIILFYVAVASVSCSKKGDGTNPPATGNDTAARMLNYSIKGVDAAVSFVQGHNQITIKFPDTIISGENIIAKFTLSPGATATVNQINQVSGMSANDYRTDVTYRITAADGITTSDWVVTGYNNDTCFNWGLGHFKGKQVDNDRPYNWYIDQGATGAFSNVNCGPSSGAMSAKWSDAAFTGTAEDARNSYNTVGNLWYPATVSTYLLQNNIPFKMLQDFTRPVDDDLKLLEKCLDNGNILIVMLNTSAISHELLSTQRVGKYYDFNFGHCIVLKGYVHVDGNRFFQVYDPWDWGAAYPEDHSPKGKDRFYREEEVMEGCLQNTNAAWQIFRK